VWLGRLTRAEARTMIAGNHMWSTGLHDYVA
jgi:hypothetical protein